MRQYICMLMASHEELNDVNVKGHGREAIVIQREAVLRVLTPSDQLRIIYQIHGEDESTDACTYHSVWSLRRRSETRLTSVDFV